MFKRFYRRRFLNRRGHHAGAYVLADCTVEEWAKDVSVDATLTIADCSRLVTLDFSFGSSDHAQASNAFHKARELKEVLDDFIVALGEAQVEAEARRRARPRVADRN